MTRLAGKSDICGSGMGYLEPRLQAAEEQSSTVLTQKAMDASMTTKDFSRCRQQLQRSSLTSRDRRSISRYSACVSDVPELDRLLDEHDNFRRNVLWDRRDRAFVVWARAGFIGFVASLCSIAFGAWGLVVVPVLIPVVCRMLPTPRRRDPFARYQFK